MPPGDEATVQQVLAHSKPRRLRHGRRSTWVEEFLVQWGPEHITFGDAFERYYLTGFDVESINNPESTVYYPDLLHFVATKRPTREHRRSLRRPPLSTNYVVKFATSL